jgi:hypothetical protein
MLTMRKTMKMTAMLIIVISKRLAAYNARLKRLPWSYYGLIRVGAMKNRGKAAKIERGTRIGATLG